MAHNMQIITYQAGPQTPDTEVQEHQAAQDALEKLKEMYKDWADSAFNYVCSHDSPFEDPSRYHSPDADTQFFDATIPKIGTMMVELKFLLHSLQKNMADQCWKVAYRILTGLCFCFTETYFIDAEATLGVNVERETEILGRYFFLRIPPDDFEEARGNQYLQARRAAQESLVNLADLFTTDYEVPDFWKDPVEEVVHHLDMMLVSFSEIHNSAETFLDSLSQSVGLISATPHGGLWKDRQPISVLHDLQRILAFLQRPEHDFGPDRGLTLERFATTSRCINKSYEKYTAFISPVPGMATASETPKLPPAMEEELNRFSTEVEFDTCSVCLEIPDGKLRRLDACNHWVCGDCLSKLRYGDSPSHNKCPLCRAQIMEEPSPSSPASEEFER